MNIDELTTDDFIHNNTEVWETIETLPEEQIEYLLDKWSDDNEINSGLTDILTEKSQNRLIAKLKECLTTEQDVKDMERALLTDRDTTWDFLGRVLDEISP